MLFSLISLCADIQHEKKIYPLLINHIILGEICQWLQLIHFSHQYNADLTCRIGSTGCNLTVWVSSFWKDSFSTFGSSGLSFQHYSRPYIGIICTRLSCAQGLTLPPCLSASLVKGGAFSVSVFSFWFTRFLLPLWYLLSTNCFTRPAVKVFRLPVKSAGRLFLLAAQLLSVHPNSHSSGLVFPLRYCALFHPLLMLLPVLSENQPLWSSDKTRDAEKINYDSEKN